MALLIVAGMALAVPVIAITAAPRTEVANLAAGASASAKASDDHGGPKKDKGLKGFGRGLGNGQGNGNGGLKGNGNARGPITIRAISGPAALARHRRWLDPDDLCDQLDGHHQGRPADRGR